MYYLACTLPWFLPALSKFYWSSLPKRHLTLTKCAYKYLHFSITPHVHLESSVFTRCLGSQPFWSHVCNIYGLFILLVSSLTTSQKNNSPDNVTNCDKICFKIILIIHFLYNANAAFKSIQFCFSSLFLSQMLSEGEFDDREILHLQERANRLLLREYDE